MNGYALRREFGNEILTFLGYDVETLTDQRVTFGASTYINSRVDNYLIKNNIMFPSKIKTVPKFSWNADYTEFRIEEVHDWCLTTPQGYLVVSPTRYSKLQRFRQEIKIIQQDVYKIKQLEELFDLGIST